MLKYAHHIHYVVRNREDIMAYLEKNFGMKPDDVIEIKRGLKDAIYDIGHTHIQLSEPSDPNTGMGRFLATNGPGVYHVAWAVDDIRNVAKGLLAKGTKMRGKEGIQTSERGYLMSNIELDSSHGLWWQLAEGARDELSPPLGEERILKYVHHVHYAVRNLKDMMTFLELNFAMKPDDVLEHKEGRMRDAIYDIGQTLIEITETSDPNSGIGKFLATNGPGVYYVAWGVDNIQEIARDLVAKGNKLRNGVHQSSRGYAACNVDFASSHGLWLQLAEGTRETKR